MPEDTPEMRASRGAALLDSKLPGWTARIDVGRLEINSACRCVLGQLGGYLELAECYLNTCAADVLIAYGFAGEIDGTLNAAWKSEIAMRLAPSVQHQVNAAVAAPARRPVRVA